MKIVKELPFAVEAPHLKGSRSDNECRIFAARTGQTTDQKIYAADALTTSPMYWLTLQTDERHLDTFVKTAPDSVMTVKEVADYLRVNQRTVYRLAVERRLPGFKVGANWRFKLGEIDSWIAAQTSASTSPSAPGESGGKTP